MPAYKSVQRDSVTPKKRRSGQRLSADEKRHAQGVFLAAFSEAANVTAACRRANISRETLYRWQEHDEEFSFRFQQAEAEANDVIRAAIYQRAILGVDKPLHYQGRVVVDEHGRRLTVKEYSDTLLIFLAKARMPEYRDKQHIEHSGGLDVNVLAAEADAKFRAFLAASSATSVLGQPNTSAES